MLLPLMPLLRFPLAVTPLLMSPGPGSPKRLRTMATIGTHDGTFHCDEVLACFLLRQLPRYKDAKVVRTRDPKALATCDVVVDVGGEYDPGRHRYDHHQRSFAETMHSLCAEKPWVTKLSSAGLVYMHFGEEVITSITGLGKEDANVTTLYNKKRFWKAVEMVGAEFLDRLHFYWKAWLPARQLVEMAILSRHKVDESGEIVEFQAGGCPWKEHLFTLEETLSIDKAIKYAIFTDQKGSWRVQCVPVAVHSFENRLSLPESWRGLRDEALSSHCGIPGCVFVHSGGFIGGHSTRDGALEMARRSLKAAASQCSVATA
ncbi:MYG1 exonuclease isoform X3 [Petromyzon marinus]|uniref:MYG1 exonuclease isoform X3 n=1 Tax=Petromyzon marinus TaxID=7757 RepID=UPI003F71BF9E